MITPTQRLEREVARLNEDAATARANYISDLEWFIRDLQRAVESAKRGDTLYGSEFSSSLIQTIPNHALESRLLAEKANRLQFIVEDIKAEEAK